LTTKEYTDRSQQYNRNATTNKRTTEKLNRKSCEETRTTQQKTNTKSKQGRIDRNSNKDVCVCGVVCVVCRTGEREKRERDRARKRKRNRPQTRNNRQASNLAKSATKDMHRNTLIKEVTKATRNEK